MPSTPIADRIRRAEFRLIVNGAERSVTCETDTPLLDEDTFVRAVDYVHAPEIDPGAARAILDQNAGVLLGIGPS